MQDIAVVVLGDSVSVADSPNFDDGVFGTGSWASYVDGDPVDVQGGWAMNGATTGDIVGHATPVGVDVLVIMAGTNDVLQGVPWAITRDNLITVARRSGVDHVVLCSIVPSTRARTENVEFHSRLADLALAERWDAVDCAVDVRDEDGGWLPGDSEDGVHPTARGAEAIGRTVREHLLGT